MQMFRETTIGNVLDLAVIIPPLDCTVIDSRWVGNPKNHATARVTELLERMFSTIPDSANPASKGRLGIRSQGIRARNRLGGLY